VKFHIKFKILFVHFLPNSIHQTCFLSSHTRNHVSFHPPNFVQGSTSQASFKDKLVD
jgi:hypothetical protein